MRNVKTPRFQQRHYEAIAEVMAKSAEQTNVFAIHVAVKNLCAMFKADNPKFSVSKFKEACDAWDTLPSSKGKDAR